MDHEIIRLLELMNDPFRGDSASQCQARVSPEQTAVSADFAACEICFDPGPDPLPFPEPRPEAPGESHLILELAAREASRAGL